MYHDVCLCHRKSVNHHSVLEEHARNMNQVVYELARMSGDVNFDAASMGQFVLVIVDTFVIVELVIVNMCEWMMHTLLAISNTISQVAFIQHIARIHLCVCNSWLSV